MASRTRPIEPSEVRNLALEGGGGKGLAYVGALAALESLGVLERVKAVSGSSAGAITALLISLGYSAAGIEKYLANADFTRFFDPALPRKRPTVGLPYESIDGETEIERLASLAFDHSALDSILPVLFARSGTASAQAIRILSWIFDAPSLSDLQRVLRNAGGKPPFDRLLRDYKPYLVYLGRDMGLFSGEAARKEFARIIWGAIASRYPNMPESEFRRPWVTFEDFVSLFPERDLIITGSNLSTGRTQIFSYTTTPQFPVADAVRISMGLPFIYKPYVITRKLAGHPPCGTYVDGGLWNNIPFREFRSSRRNTLGLRLELLEPEPVESLGELIGRTLYFAAFGTGETQALDEWEPDTIVLDTAGLDLIDFNPPAAQLRSAIKRAARAVYHHWQISGPIDVDDPQDEAASELRRQRAANCVGSRRL